MIAKRKIVNDTVIKLNTLLKGNVTFQEDFCQGVFIITIENALFIWKYSVYYEKVHDRLYQEIFWLYKIAIMERFIIKNE